MQNTKSFYGKSEKNKIYFAGIGKESEFVLVSAYTILWKMLLYCSIQGALYSCRFANLARDGARHDPCLKISYLLKENEKVQEKAVLRNVKTNDGNYTAAERRAPCFNIYTFAQFIRVTFLHVDGIICHYLNVS